jgi:hypothetical protein
MGKFDNGSASSTSTGNVSHYLTQVKQQTTLAGVAGVFLGSHEVLVSDFISNENKTSKRVLKENLEVILNSLKKCNEITDAEIAKVYAHIDTLPDSPLGTPRSGTPVGADSRSSTPRSVSPVASLAMDSNATAAPLLASPRDRDNGEPSFFETYRTKVIALRRKNTAGSQSSEAERAASVSPVNLPDSPKAGSEGPSSPKSK